MTVSADGSIAIIGAHNDSGPSGERTGSAYVFEANDGSWSQQAKLTIDDSHSDDQLGSSVSLSADGTMTVIGAPDDTTPSAGNGGSVYIFEANNGSWN